MSLWDHGDIDVPVSNQIKVGRGLEFLGARVWYLKAPGSGIPEMLPLGE
jgi:hypothetical protein